MPPPASHISHGGRGARSSSQLSAGSPANNDAPPSVPPSTSPAPPSTSSAPPTPASTSYGSVDPHRGVNSEVYSPISRRNDSVEIDDSETRPLLPSYDDIERKKRQLEGDQCIAARHVLAFMAFLGFVNVYCLRVNLSVALVAMVNSTDTETNKSSSQECPDPHAGQNKTVTTGEFDWDEQTQGYVLGAFFYGYTTTQLPGGWLASKMGGKNLFGYGVLCTSLLTIVTPFAARYSVYLFIVLRVLEGIGEGVTFPAMHAMWGNWAPVWERSKLVGFTYAGAQLGTVIALPISGVLCDSNVAGGWPSVFYIFGALGCLWFLVWMLMVHDTPRQHPRISASEREYIESSIGKKEKVNTPWRQILTSSAVWGLAVTHFANNWGFYTLLTCLPSYMKNILKFDMKENGILSAVPYAACWLFQNLSGFCADYLRGHGYLSTRMTRKIFNTLGLLLPAALLVLTGYVGCDHILAMVCLTLSVGLSGLTMGGYNVNHLDIAPKFAGVLMGITNALATIPGFVGPALVGYLTNNNQTRGQWQIVFYITAGISVLGTVVYDIFGKGEEMWWSRAPPKRIRAETVEDSSGQSSGVNSDPPPAYTEH